MLAAADRADAPPPPSPPGSARLLAQVLLSSWNDAVHLPQRLASLIDQWLADIEVQEIDQGAHRGQTLQAMLRVSWLHTARCGVMPGYAFARKPGCWRRPVTRSFRRRDD